METNNRDYQIFLLHSNGNQSFHAWFTYEEAEKRVTKLMDEDPKISCYEILLDNKTVAQGVQAVSE